MSADIQKLAVFDDRIVQHRPKYAVEKGALSVTNSPFNAIAANTGQHTYNILVPSENVFIDRAVDWTSTVYCQLQWVLTEPLTPGVDNNSGFPGIPFPGFGSGGLSLCAFPLQSLTTTMTATINDTTVTINSADVLPQVLRMTDMKKNRMVRTCPTQLDKYSSYDDAYLSINSPLQGFNEAMNVDEVPNGAFPGTFWTSQNGTALWQANGNGSVVVGSGAGAPQWVYNTRTGVPCIPFDSAPGAAPIPVGTIYTLYFAFTSTEKLVLSPFVFSDVHEWDTGLFGCQNIQLVMNLQSPARVIRATSDSIMPGVQSASVSIVPGSCVYNTSAPSGGSSFANSRVNLQFLTPSLSVPLPPKSIVPYMEFPRYISSNFQPMPPGTGFNPSLPGTGGLQLQSQTITLPTIPDLLIIYVRDGNGYKGTLTPQPGQVLTGADATQGDFMLPIQNISVNFDNFAGLLSAHTQQQLYKMSVHNGLEMDWAQWSGLASSSSASPGVNNLPFGLIPTVGGPLVLKPGRDIVLQEGQAPSLVGNFVLQFNLTVGNYTKNTVTPQLVVITANSGYFETIKGSSRVIKGVLTEQDIISAPIAPEATTGALRRAVGGSVLGALGNAVHSIAKVYQDTKPYVSAVKECLASGAKASGNAAMKRVSDAIGSVGYGMSLKDRMAGAVAQKAQRM